MALHKNLTSTDLHEPKDIAVASINNVYVSDGAGSGSWGVLPGRLPSNTVTIDVVGDFPAAVSDVIVTADETQYLIGPDVDLGSARIVLGTNSILSGVNRQISKLTSTTTGSLITSIGVDCRIDCLTLNATSAPKIIEFDGSGTGTMRLTDCVSATHTGIGIEATNALSLVLDFCLMSGGTTSLLLQGANNSSLLVDTCGLISFSGKGVDFGTSLWGDCIIKDSLFSGDGGSFAISGLTSSANINAGRRAGVTSNTFNGAGTPLENITQQDIRFFFLGNDGIENTQVAGQMSLSGSALTTTLAAATPAKINATTWTSSKTDRVSVDSSGILTYDGEEDIEALVNLAVNGSGSSGSNEYNLYIAKNGTELTESKARATMPSTSDTNLMTFSIVRLSQGDTLEAFIEQATGVDFVGKDANMSVKV